MSPIVWYLGLALVVLGLLVTPRGRQLWDVLTEPGTQLEGPQMTGAGTIAGAATGTAQKAVSSGVPIIGGIAQAGAAAVGSAVQNQAGAPSIQPVSSWGTLTG